MSTQFDAFLSYSHKDEALVEKVQNILERWVLRVEEDNKEDGKGNGKGKKSRLHVFRDKTDISLGGLTERIRDAISRSTCLVVFCSRASAGSDYVYQELAEFLGKYDLESPEGRKEALDHVFFAGLESSPEENLEIISLLTKRALGTKLKRADRKEILQRVRDSLYADYGSHRGAFAGRKIRDETYKLAAAILHTDKDKLCRRAERRRRRLIFSFAAAAVTICLLLAGLRISYMARRDRDARSLALAAENRLADGDCLLAAQLALASTGSRWGYRTIAPEAVRVMAEAVHVYAVPSEDRIEAADSFGIRSSGLLSLDVSGDGRYAAAVNEKGDLILQDTWAREQVWTCRTPLTGYRSRICFLKEGRFLVQNFGACRCYGLKDPDPLWEISWKTPASQLHFDLPDDSSLGYLIDDPKADGLFNMKLTDRKGGEFLLFLERKQGLTLRDAATGSIRARLAGKDMEALLPEGVSPYKDLHLYPLSRILDLQIPEDIGYDADRDLFLVPCYKRQTADGWSDEFCTGLLSWSPADGKAAYVALEDPGEGTETGRALFYPGSGLFIRRISRKEDLFQAYDESTGQLLWDYADPDGLGQLCRGKDPYEGKDSLILLEKSCLIFLDPMTGKELGRAEADLESGESLLMFLETGTGQLTLLTDRGRVCILEKDRLLAGEENVWLPDGEATWSSDPLYIQADRSGTGRGCLFCSDMTQVRKYEVGLKNDAYKTIRTKETGDDIFAGKLPCHAENGFLLMKESGGYSLYDSEIDAQEPVWKTADKDLSLIGTDPADKSLIFQKGEMNDLVRVGQKTGKSVSEKLPLPVGYAAGLLDLRILSPVIAGNDYMYVMKQVSPGSVSYKLCKCGTTAEEGTLFSLSDAVGDSVPDRKVRLLTDPSGRYAAVLGLEEGVWFVDTKNGFQTLLDFDPDSETGEIDLQKNVFFTDNSYDAAGVFDSGGRYLAVNYSAVNRLVLYDTQGKEVSRWDYFNTTITDMCFAGDSLLVFTYDGKIQRRRIWDMKLQKSLSLPGNDSRFVIRGESDEALWVLSGQNTAYCVDRKNLGCRQRIRNVLTVDAETGRVYVFRNRNGVMTVGSLPLLTRDGIMDRTRQYIGSSRMTEEDRAYYGVDF